MIIIRFRGKTKEKWKKIELSNDRNLMDFYREIHNKYKESKNKYEYRIVIKGIIWENERRIWI